MPGRGELVRLEECGLAVEPGVEGHLRGLRRLLANRPALAGDGRSRPPRGRAPLLLGGGGGRFGRLLRFALRRAASRPAPRPTKRLTEGAPHVSIERFDNVLVLAPHTDDGEFGCGGTMARLIESGVKVTYAAFSTAAKSVPEGFPKDVLKHEVRAATGAARHPRGGPQGLRLRGPHLPDRAPGHPRGDDRPAAASSTPTACSCPRSSTCTRTTRPSPRRVCAPSSAPR